MLSRNSFQIRIILVFFFILICLQAKPWGFWAHKRINRIAVFTLPNEMLYFYKYHIEYLTESAVNPDKRRYATKDEAPRHYIDIDHYGVYPFDNMPRKWNDAVEAFTEDTLLAYGIVPWHIQTMLYRLKEAFKRRDGGSILRLSADMGHYVADAHVPLHTTKNYNGQLTNQKGIHGFWESRIPELLGEEYDYFVGKAVYIDNPLEETWDIVLKSHALVDSVLSLEKKLRASYPQDQVYSFEKRGNSTVRVYSEGFSIAYNNAMGAMVESRMRESIIAVGSFLFTAWVNAGQPDMRSLINENLNEEMKNEMLQLKKDTLITKDKIYGRPHPNTGFE